jgi:hypothetical protein
MKLFSRIIHQRLALSPQLDLPIALGMLKLEENNRLPALDAFCITGELALSGRMRAVKGVLSIALEAKRRCRQTLIVPLENAAEAAVVEGVDVYGEVRCLKSSISARRNLLEPVRSTNDWTEANLGIIISRVEFPALDQYSLGHGHIVGTAAAVRKIL